MRIAVRIIAYYRVSTKKQGASGLGIEGQQAAVREFAKRLGATVIRATSRSKAVSVPIGRNSRRRSPTPSDRRPGWSWQSWTGWHATWRFFRL